VSWLLWLGVVASAKSDPCESIKEKADAFTGQPVRTYLAVGGWRVTASADAIQLEWELVQNDPHRDALPAGTVLKVRTEDGTIVDLVSKGETNPERKVVGSSVFTHWAATWTVSPEAAAAIAKSPPGGDAGRGDRPQVDSGDQDLRRRRDPGLRSGVREAARRDGVPGGSTGALTPGRDGSSVGRASASTPARSASPATTRRPSGSTPARRRWAKGTGSSSARPTRSAVTPTTTRSRARSCETPPLPAAPRALSYAGDELRFDVPGVAAGCLVD
jgi:hypothetical protein